MQSRRRLLSTIGGGLAAITGCISGTDDQGDERMDMPHEDGETVDLVEDAGADPTGADPINDALATAVEDGVTVVFPEGEYWIDGDGFHDLAVSNLSLIGEGDVTLRPTPDTNPLLLRFEADNLRIENLTVDQTAADTSTGISTLAAQRLAIRDVVFEGPGDGPGGPTEEYGDNGERHGPFNIIPGVTDPDGRGIIENVEMSDGTVPYYRKGGAWVANRHAGELLFRRCTFAGFSDNAIYASGAGHPDRGENGAVGVENCFFRNNNVTAIRLGTPGSYARHCTVVLERDEIPELPWGAVTGRAGWVWYEFDGTYEDIDVVSDHPRGVGIYAHESHEGPITVERCRIGLDADGTHALRVDGSDGPVTVADTSVVGEAGSDAVCQLAGCEIDVENLHISQSGPRRDGMSLTDVTGEIADSVIDVAGLAFVPAGETDVQATNIHDEGAGPAPDPEHEFDATDPGPRPTPPDGPGEDSRITGRSR